jgi:hypothetical protein
MLITKGLECRFTKKKKKKNFSEIDLTSKKTNRSQNGNLLPKITPVEQVRVATGPLSHLRRNIIFTFFIIQQI